MTYTDIVGYDSLLWNVSKESGINKWKGWLQWQDDPTQSDKEALARGDMRDDKNNDMNDV